MNIPEEVGSTTRSIIDALKSQPATLALIVANVAMLIFVFYAMAKAAEFRDTMIRGQFEYQKHVTELLSKCVVPP
jgi:predicted PurR-regulated permease PerM